MVHQSDGLYDPKPNDAFVRAWRTFGQGAVVAALVSVGLVLSNVSENPDWKGVALACGQAVVTALVTYAHNKVSPKV